MGFPSLLLDLLDPDVAEVDRLSLRLDANRAALRLEVVDGPRLLTVHPERYLRADARHLPLVPFARRLVQLGDGLGALVVEQPTGVLLRQVDLVVAAEEEAA